jgi:hypothetical protein
MKWTLLFLCLSLSAHAAIFQPEKFGKKYAHRIGVEFEASQIKGLAARSDQALDRIIAISLRELRKRGDEAWADQREEEWNSKYSGFLTQMTSSYYDIGDHKPLVDWLASFYDHLESVLGVTVCKSLHLSDIKTFNFCIPVVFHPCTFSMDQVPGDRIDEYRNHFAEGAVYYGLVPVVTYWVIDIACMAATSGIGLCGLAADAGEFVMGKWISPKLSDRVYKSQCGGIK